MTYSIGLHGMTNIEKDTTFYLHLCVEVTLNGKKMENAAIFFCQFDDEDLKIQSGKKYFGIQHHKSTLKQLFTEHWFAYETFSEHILGSVKTD